MAYTSSALSFLLEDLGKTVVGFHGSNSFRLRSSQHCLDLDWGTNTYVTTAKRFCGQLDGGVDDRWPLHYTRYGTFGNPIHAIRPFEHNVRVFPVLQPYAIPGQQSIEDVIIRFQRLRQS